MTNDKRPWINPVGGLGDMLMVSGVLKQAVEQAPSRRYNLIRRTNYLSIFNGHPAIERIGFPERDAPIADVTYWSLEELGPDLQRPYQILARTFGLSTPVEEKLYLPGGVVEDSMLHSFIPWKKRNIVIAPASDSPRKAMNPLIWHHLVEHLKADGMFVAQVGRSWDLPIRNAYSLLGLTTPRQLISLLYRFDCVVASDNFIMHAAHLTGRRAVVLWGPTRHQVYGYRDQIHIQMAKMCGLSAEEGCIGVGKNKGGETYGTTCPLGARHCMDQIKPEDVYEAVNKALQK